MSLARRRFVKQLGALAAGAAAGSAPSRAFASGGRVVVVGAGFGGATAAKYIRMWAPDIDVVLIERNAQFISCPLSNLVLAGNATLRAAEAVKKQIAAAAAASLISTLVNEYKAARARSAAVAASTH